MPILVRPWRPRSCASYSDKHGVFRVNNTGAVQGDGMTQFGRSLHALNIDILCANTPQAKGRVERANKTLQDRLVKELRLQGISTIAAGNQLLPGFPGQLQRPLRPRTAQPERTSIGPCQPATTSLTSSPGAKSGRFPTA